MPDMYGRPWAQIWEQYFERDMQKPKAQDIFDFGQVAAGIPGGASMPAMKPPAHSRSCSRARCYARGMRRRSNPPRGGGRAADREGR